MADMNNSLSGPTPYADAYGISAPTGYEAGLERSLKLLDNFKNNNPQFFGGPGGTTTSSDPLSSAKNLVNQPIQLGPSIRPAGYQEPIEFSSDLTKFERYYNHPSYNKLGFHPFRDNETFYNDNTHWTEDYSRMFGQAGKLFGAGFVGTYETIGDIFQGENLQFADDISKTYEKASMIGSSSRGGLAGFGNNLILNSAYTAGIITDYAVSELALAALTYGSGGGLAPVTGTAAAGKTAAFTKAMGGIWDIFKAQNNVRRVINGVEAAQDVTKMRRFFNSVASGLNPLENTMQFAKELAATEGQIYKMTNLAKVSKGFGAFYRDTKAAAMTWSESKLEAGMVEQEVRQDLIDKYIDEKGYAPTGADMQNIEELAYGAATTTALYNAPLIYGTNAITFGTLFKGYTPLAATAEAAGDGLSKNITRQMTGKVGEFLYQKTPGAFKAAAQFVKNPSLKQGFGYLGRYAAGNFSEGVQEIGQEIIAGAAKDYYENLFDDPAYAYGSIWTSSMGKAAKDMMSAQGLEVFMSGFLMGGIAGPYTKMLYGVGTAAEYIKDPKAFKENKAKREAAYQEIITSLNEAGKDPGTFFNNFYNSFVRQRKTAAEAVEAGLSDDQLAQQNAKDKALFEQVHNLLRVNGLDDYYNYLESLKKLSVAEIKDAIPQLAGRSETETRAKIDKLQARMKEIATDYIAVKKEMKNPYRPSLYKKGTEEYNNEVFAQQAWEELSRQMIFYKHSFVRHAERTDAVLNEAKSNPAVGKASYTDFSVMFSADALSAEIEALKAEVQIEPLDAEQRKIQAIKQERLDILTEFQEGLNKATVTRKDGTRAVDRRKLTYIQPAYEKFINHLSEKTASPIDAKNARKTLSLIYDAHTLKSDADLYQEMYNMIADPVGFRDAMPRVTAAFKAIYEKRKAMSDDLVNKFDQTQRQHELVKALAKIGVVIGAEDIEEFFNNNTRPKNFYSAGSSEKISNEDALMFLVNTLVLKYYNDLRKTTEAETSVEEAQSAAARAQSEVTTQVDYSEAAAALDPYLQNVLNLLYEKAKRQGSELGYSQWELTPSGSNAISMLTELQQMFEMSEGENIAQWIEDNKNSDKVREVLSRYGFTVADVSGILQSPGVFVKESLPKGFTLSNEAAVNGLFIIEDIGAEEDETSAPRFFIVDNRSNFVSDKSYAKLEDALEARRELAKTYEAQAEQFIFQGQAFYKGQLVNNGRGVTYRVVTDKKQMAAVDKAAEKFEQEGKTVKKKLRLVIVEDLNNPENVGTEEERSYLKGSQRLLPGSFKEFSDEGMYQILDLYKYTKIYAHRSEQDEQRAMEALGGTMEDPKVRELANKFAENRLKTLLEGTPVEELKSRLGMRITRTAFKAGNYLSEPGGKKVNAHVREQKEQFTIAITLDGNIIGYSRSLQNVAFFDNDGNITPYYEVFEDSLALKRIFKSSLPVLELRSQANRAFFKAMLIQKNVNDLMNKGPEGELAERILDYDEMIELIGDINIGKGSYDFAKSDESYTVDQLEYSTIEGGYYIIDRTTQAPKLRGKSIKSASVENRTVMTNLKGDAKKKAQQKIQSELDNNPNVLDKRGRYVLAVELPNGAIKFVSLKSPVISEATQETVLKSIESLVKDAKANPNADNSSANAELLRGPMYIALAPGRFMELNINNLGQLSITLSRTSNMLDAGKVTSNRDLTENPFESFQDFVEEINKTITENKKLLDNRVSSIVVSKDSFRVSLPKAMTANQFIESNPETDTKPGIVESIAIYVSPVGANTVSTSKKANDAKAPATKKPSLIESARQKAKEQEQKSNQESEEEAPLLDVLAQQSRNIPPPAQEAQVTEDLGSRIQELESELIATQTRVRKELMAEKGGSYPGILNDVSSNPEVKAIQEEIQKIKSQFNKGAKKVLTKPKGLYDAQAAETIDEFVDWVSKNLPRSISVQQVINLRENLHNGNLTVGEFIMHLGALGNNISQIRGKIRVGANTPFRYHEAFHAVFRMLLTDEEISKYLDIAKKEVADKLRSRDGYNFAGSEGVYRNLKDALSALRNMDPMYEEMSEQDLEQALYEEYLADQFESWKKDIKTQTSPTNKSLFARIVDFIVKLFTQNKTSKYVALFEGIDSGKYVGTDIQENRFTKAVESGVPVMLALKNITVGDNYVTIGGKPRIVNRYFAGDRAHELVQSIALAKFKIDTEAGPHQKKTDEEKYSVIINDLLDHYDIEDSYYTDRDDYYYILQDLKDYNFVLFNSSAELIEASEKYLKDLDYSTQEFEDSNEDAIDTLGQKEAEEESSTENRIEKHSIGGLKALPKWVRLYIGTTAVPQGAFGKPVTEGSYAYTSVNAYQIYNGLLHILEGTTDSFEQIRKLAPYYTLAFSNAPTSTALFVKKLFDDHNISFDEEGRLNVSEIKSPTRLNSILTNLNRFRVDYKFFAYSPNGHSNVLNANARDNAITQFDFWKAAFSTKVNSRGVDKVFADSAEAFQTLMDALIDKEEGLKYRDVDEALKLSNEIYEASGVYIEPMLIKYSVLKIHSAEENITPEEQMFITSHDVQEIDPEGVKMIIQNLTSSAKVNPFTKFAGTESDEVEFEGSASRIAAIASSNVVFNDSIGATSFVNADNEMIYSFQIPTYELRRAREVRDIMTPEGAAKEEDFVLDNMLLEDPRFMSMLSEFGLSRVDGIKILDLWQDENGDVKKKNTARNRNVTGTTFTKFTDTQYMHVMLAMYLAGKHGNTGKNKSRTFRNQSGNLQNFATTIVNLGVIESTSTMDVAELPVHAMVELKGKKVVLSENGKNVLYRLIKTEYDNIQRVLEEIDNPDVPQIEGYHNGAKRGLKFVDMVALLGGDNSTIIPVLEQAALDGKTFEEAIAETPIDDSVEKFFNETIDNTFKYMLDIGMLKKSKDGVTAGRGIPFNIINGVTIQRSSVAEDNNAVLDDIANAQLNLITKTNQSGVSSIAVQHNLAQIIMSNFVNTQAIANLMYGHTGKFINPKNLSIAEVAKTYVKRAKQKQTGGNTAESKLADPSLGVNFPTESFEVLTLADEKYRTLFDLSRVDSDKTDAQTYLTTKSFRHMMHGFGLLDADLAQMIDAVEKGENISAERYFGNGKVKGHVQFKNSMISIKIAYANNRGTDSAYIKTSAFVLSPKLTSIKDSSGKFTIPYPGREELHDLRVKLEEHQGSDRLSMVTFESASKGATVLNEFVPKSAKYFVLQQANPSNKEKITNTSQVAQTVTADIPDDAVIYHRGKKNNGKNLKARYGALTAARLRMSYADTLQNIYPELEFKKDLSDLLKGKKATPKMEAFAEYIKNILENTAGSSRDIEIFTIEDGVVKGNPNNTIVESKFVGYFMTYIVNGTFKEKIPGHSLTLVSNYGMKVVKRATGQVDEKGHPIGEVVRDSEIRKNPSLYKDLKRADDPAFMLLNDSPIKAGDLYIDELRHNVPVYDKAGNIIDRYTEVMMPPQTFDAAKYAQNGAIPDAIARLFGVRIPSQDKHSSVAIKVVDFLPVEYGSVIVSPQELIEISGADFDIDKLFAASNNYFYNKKTKEFEAYGDVKNDEDRFRHFVHYMFANDKDFRKAYAEVKGLPVNLADFTINNLEDLGSLAETLKDNNVKNALKSLGYPSTVSEYAAAYKKLGHDLYKGALDTEITQLKSAITFNDYTSKPRKQDPKSIKEIAPAFQVAHVEPLKDVIKDLNNETKAVATSIIEAMGLEEDEKANMMIEIMQVLDETFNEPTFQHNTMIGQALARKSNKEGAKNIGSAVKSLLAWSYLQKTGYASEKEIFSLRLGASNNKRIFNDYSKTVTEDGTRKGYLLSALVSAMTDNAKERLASILGLNIEALGIVAHMVAVGVPLKTSIIFINQPVIRNYYKNLEANRDVLKQDDTKRKSFEVLLGSSILKSDDSGANAYVYKEGELTSEELKGDYIFGERELLERLTKGKLGEFDPQLDLEVAKAFYQLSQYTKYFIKVASVTGIVKGIDNITEEGFDKFLEDIKDLGDSNDFNIFSEGAFAKTLEKDLYVKEAISIYNDINDKASDLLVRRTPEFVKMLKSVLVQLDIVPYQFAKFKEQLTKDLISYFDITAYMQYLRKNGRNAELTSLSNSIVFAQDGKRTIVDYVDGLKTKFEKQGKKNEFLDRFIHTFRAESAGNKSGFDYIETNTWSKIEPIQLQRLQSAFLELYNSDPDSAIAIFHYLLVKDGGQYKSGTVMTVIPFALQQDFHEASKPVIKALNRELNGEEFVDLFGTSKEKLVGGFAANYTRHATISNRNYGSYLYLNTIQPAKENKEMSPAISIDEKAGVLSIDIFAGTKDDAQVVEIGENLTFTVDSAFDKSQLKQNLESLRAIGFIPNNNNKKLNGMFAPTAIMYNDKTYYLEEVNPEGRKLKEQREFSYYLPVGTAFTYRLGDSTGTAKTSAIQFMFGEVPTTTDILESRKVSREKREGTNETPTEFSATTEKKKSPLAIARERQAAASQEAASTRSPREILTDFNIVFTTSNGVINYIDETTGESLTQYTNMSPSQVIEKLGGEKKPVEQVENENPFVQGENISSSGSAFAKQLTNPGNTLEVTYRGETFRNAEHAYQTWKSGEFDEVAFNSKKFKPTGSKKVDTKTSYDTMVEILTEKLRQHPSLVTGINERGGNAYLEQSTHNVTGDRFWETSGQNKFMKALIDAYNTVVSEYKESESTSQPISIEGSFDSLEGVEEYMLANGLTQKEIDDNRFSTKVILKTLSKASNKKTLIDEYIERIKNCK